MAESLSFPTIPNISSTVTTLYEQSVPANTPDLTYGKLYKKAAPDDNLYWKVGSTEYKISGGGGGVASAQGTADQVLVNGTSGSAETGAVTLTLPQSVGTTSAVQFARLGLGVAPSNPLVALYTASQVKFGTDSLPPLMDADSQLHWTTGNMSYMPGGPIPYTCFVTRYDANISSIPPVPTSINDIGVISMKSNFNSGPGVDVTNAVGIKVNAFTSSGAGTIANCYGGYFTAQTIGTTTNAALYADNLLVGDDSRGRNAPARGMIVGSGSIVLGTNALLTTATNGFLHIPVCAGVPTGVPTAIGTNVPIVYDTVDHKLYIYDGGWISATFA
jgi:hypothetical protein